MGYFQVRYDSRVISYDDRGFIRLVTGVCRKAFHVFPSFRQANRKLKLHVSGNQNKALSVINCTNSYEL